VYDRGAELGNPQCGDGIEREPGNGSRRLITAQPIQRQTKRHANWRCYPRRDKWMATERMRADGHTAKDTASVGEILGVGRATFYRYLLQRAAV
jgi:hypothetical protein